MDVGAIIRSDDSAERRMANYIASDDREISRMLRSNGDNAITAEMMYAESIRRSIMSSSITRRITNTERVYIVDISVVAAAEDERSSIRSDESSA